MGRQLLPRLALTGTLLAGALAAAHARGTEPCAPPDAAAGRVRLYVPFAAAGDSDDSVRNLASGVARLTGQAPELVNLSADIAVAPGRLRCGTAGPGTLQNLAVRQWLSFTGLAGDAARPMHVDQGARATQALLDGDVDFTCNASSLAGTEALGAAPRILAVRDPAQFLRQQAQFYERLVTLPGGRS